MFCLAEGVDSTMSFAFHARGVLDFFRRGSEKPFPPANFAGDYVRNSEAYFLRRNCIPTIHISSYIVVVRRPCLPFVSSSPTPHITINFSTTAPQHMLPTHQMSSITFPHSTLTHLTIYFPLTIFLVTLSLFFPMFIPVVLIHDPNFLLILLCPAFPIPQANMACSIFSPI